MSALAFKIFWRAMLYPALAFGVFAFIFFWLYAHPKRNISPREPESLGLKPERVKIRTSDGLNLDAWFIAHNTARKTVIICHGYPMDKGDVLDLTSFLSRNFNLLYFDFRATGRSKGFFSTGGAREVKDIDAAVEFLKARGLGDGIGIFGFSMGASTALLSSNAAIKARVVDAPYANLMEELEYIFIGFGAWRGPLLLAMKAWGLVLMRVDFNAVSPARAAAALTTPVLLIHGSADTQVPSSSALKIKAANPSVELWLIKGAGHGTTRETAGPEYDSRVAGFFIKNL